MNPTGDPEQDALRMQKLQKELARIQRNQDRRLAREKAKGKTADSPAGASPGGPSDADGGTSTADGTLQKGRGRNKDGTARKCANCGQVGHIKTNRKLVPTFDCMFCDSTEFEPLNGGKKRKGNGSGRGSAAAAGSGSAGATGSFVDDSFSKFIL